MRAREFIREQADLPPETKAPLRNTFVLPGLQSSDPYKNYRFGVAMARARSDQTPDDINPYRPVWTAETPFGEHGMVAGMNSAVNDIIDNALRMTKTPGGKRLVSTAESDEPSFVDTKSPVKAFKGYPR